MPILQYVCPICGGQFEKLVKSHTQEVLCPTCKNKAERSYSGDMFSATGKPIKKCSGNCSSCGGCK